MGGREPIIQQVQASRASLSEGGRAKGRANGVGRGADGLWTVALSRGRRKNASSSGKSQVGHVSPTGEPHRASLHGGACLPGGRTAESVTAQRGDSTRTKELWWLDCGKVGLCAVSAEALGRVADKH